MRDRMRPGLFDEWLAFAELEPFGERSDDAHLAYTLAVLVNAITGGKLVGKDRRQAYTAEDFLLRHAEPVPRRNRTQRMSVNETVRYVTGLMQQVGAQLPTDLKRLSEGADD